MIYLQFTEFDKYNIYSNNKLLPKVVKSKHLAFFLNDEL